MDLIQRLLSCGIQVELSGGDLTTADACRIIIPNYLLEAAPTPAPQVSNQPETDYISLHMSRTGAEWIFSLWESVPGPDEHDFIATFATLENLLTAVLNYYIGGPTLIGSWLAPLHRHPELHTAQVRFAIRNATLADPELFDDIARKRQNRALGSNFFAKNRWVLAQQYQFLALPHVSDPNLTLYMRRDAQEAFIVRKEAQ